MESSDDDDSIPNSEHCPICLETRKENSIALLPCSHAYDISCIRGWMIAKLPQTLRCPLCRSSVTKVLLNQGQENEKEVLVSNFLSVDKILVARQDSSSNFSVEDQALLIEALEARRLEDLAIQRLLEIGPVSVMYEPVEYMSVIAPFEDRIAVVSRSLSLKVKQSGNRTSSILRRWLTIEYYKPKFTNKFRELQGRAHFSSRSAMHKARHEIQYLQEEYSEAYQWPNTRNMRWVYRRPDQDLARSDRGIRSITLSKKVRANETPRALQLSSGKTSISIKWTTKLTEWGPARPDGAAPITFEDRNPQILQDRRRVRLATEQIRSALEWLRSSNANDQVHLLDRLTTNILEPGSPRAEQCHDCPAKHLPGFCFGMWSLKHP